MVRLGVPGSPRGVMRPHGGAQADGAQTVGLCHSLEALGSGKPSLLWRACLCPQGRGHFVPRSQSLQTQPQDPAQAGSGRAKRTEASPTAHLPAPPVLGQAPIFTRVCHSISHPDSSDQQRPGPNLGDLLPTGLQAARWGSAPGPRFSRLAGSQRGQEWSKARPPSTLTHERRRTALLILDAITSDYRGRKLAQKATPIRVTNSPCFCANLPSSTLKIWYAGNPPVTGRLRGLSPCPAMERHPVIPLPTCRRVT